jgi:hypothetical protein
METAARSMDRRAKAEEEARGALQSDAVLAAMREATSDPAGMQDMPTSVLQSIAAVNKGSPRGAAAAAVLAGRSA